MSSRSITKHPGSKRPDQHSYRGNAVNPSTPRDMLPEKHHKGYHEKPGKTTKVKIRPRKGAVWRAVTRPVRRLPGWQKLAQSTKGQHMFSRILDEDDDA